MKPENPPALKTIPGPRGLPILGVMPEMVSDMLGLFTKTAREYGGTRNSNCSTKRIY
jgi:hypothetical protein